MADESGPIGLYDRIVSWATKGRRQPILIGKDAGGRRIPGGPYTIYQGAAALIVAIVGWNTRYLWAANMPGIAFLVFLSGAALGTGYGIGRIDFSARNPIWAGAALAGAAFNVLSNRLTGAVGGRTTPSSPIAMRFNGTVPQLKRPSGPRFAPGATDAKSSEDDDSTVHAPAVTVTGPRAHTTTANPGTPRTEPNPWLNLPDNEADARPTATTAGTSRRRESSSRPADPVSLQHQTGLEAFLAAAGRE